MKRLTLLVALLTALAAPGAAAEPVGVQAVPPTPQVAGTVVTGLNSPWAIAFLPDGSALVSERNSGQIKRIANGTATSVGTVPGVVAGGEGGLLGIAVSPSFATDRFVYAYFTASGDNRVVRMAYNTSLGQPQVLVSGIAKSSIHNGGRMTFGPDGLLYISTGDAGTSSNAQNPNSPNGKILRVTPATGAAAPGNPVSGNRMWSMGHRNVQGLAFDGAGRLWASEFGQNTWDELNLIQAGRNYGWPTVEGQAGNPNFVDPIVQWATSAASPSGIAFSRDTVWLAALGGTRLWAVPVSNGALNGTPVNFFNGTYGRLRLVTNAPDGSMWLMTNNTDGRGTPRPGDDRILRLTFGSEPPPDDPPPATGACRVTYAPTTWQDGFTANVTVTNTGTAAVSGWTLAWSFAGNQRITSAWNATVTQDGTAVTARNAGHNGSIPPGGNQSFGFQGTYSGSNAAPGAFTLNGGTCT
ncbi:PQQ-dependent sugar dehydrogenase [Actinophytocola oryzae]|uniref:Glucose/arabinose dehydrogenase n=1 Tax=Actinophytocola oryzae TaxID=502181 RepID=A0A4R7W5D0_9PSEU|nr:PQQ-dependent sugar dehydrogenase [Actinophytocola oryzae]TDV57445.1 glucose/arabinose dehydrogenase [Actinophytocola oryzae]